MPLIPTTLSTGLSSIFDPESPSLTGWPSTNLEAAEQWADAINGYASAVVPPSASSAAARNAMRDVLLVVTPEAGNAIIQLPLALTAYAGVLAAGMAPAFISVPPAVPAIILPVAAIGIAGGPSSAVVAALTGIIDAWFRTGFAVPAPIGPPVVWS